MRDMWSKAKLPQTTQTRSNKPSDTKESPAEVKGAPVDAGEEKVYHRSIPGAVVLVCCATVSWQ